MYTETHHKEMGNTPRKVASWFHATVLYILLVVCGILVTIPYFDHTTSAESHQNLGTDIPADPKQVAANLSYVSIGDSIASGAGLPTQTGTSECDQSPEAYPNLVAKSLQMKLTSLACSGARTSAGIIKTQFVYATATTIQPQIDRLFESKTTPNLVTITIGANDLGWMPIFTKCMTSTCDTDAATIAMYRQLPILRKNLDTVLTRIHEQYPSPPHVIVTGFFQPFPATISADCSDMKGVTQSEATWTRDVTIQINNYIQSMLENYPSVSFSPIDFTGHEACTSDPWILSDDSKAPFHANTKGEQAMASAIIDTYTRPTSDVLYGFWRTIDSNGF